MLKNHFSIFLVLLLLIPATFALDAPVVRSNTHPEGVWAGMPMEFKWAAVDGVEKYCWILASISDKEIPTEDNYCTENISAYPPRKMDSGDYYFNIKSVFFDTESASTSYPIKLDVGSPSRPTLSATVLSDGGIELSWTASEDDKSGIKEYEVYRKLMANFDLRTTPIHTIVLGSVTSLIDSNEMEQSKTYHYKIRAVDNAGNTGIVSNEVHAETIAKCDLDISFLTDLSDTGNSLALSITSSDLIYHGGLKAVLPDGSTKTFFTDSTPFSEWSDSFDLSTVEEGYIDFTITAKEFFGDSCDFERRFIYDITKPAISFVFPKYNDKVSETVPLQVKVEDVGEFKSGFEPITFFVKEGSSWTSLGTADEGENSVYSINWDSFSTENGSTKLKAVVTDLAGNIVEITQTITVINAFEGAVDINSAIEQTTAAKESALETKLAFEGNAIISNEENRLFDEANVKMEEAIILSEFSDLESQTNAKLLLSEAIILFEESETVVQTSVYKTADFIFNKEQAGILLNAAGISGATEQQALEFIEKADPKRQLQILRVLDGNTEYFKPLITISFLLDVNLLSDRNSEDLILQVIEVVPKEFAEYAAELDSNISFDVLYDDPKLSFDLTKDQYRKRSFSYALKENLTQAEADALIEENIINKFVAPPVLLSIGTLAGFELPISTDLLLFLGVAVGFIIAVLVIILVLKKRKSKRKRSGFEGASEKKREKSNSGLGGKKVKEEKPKKDFWKKDGSKLPSLRKKDESPLSVFGKK